MASNVSHKFDEAALKKLLTSPQGGVAKDLLRRGLKVESKAKLNLTRNPTRVNTGRLRSSVVTVLYTTNGKLSVRVGTNVFYARWVHDGTGLYGPHAQYIVPRSKKVLRWKSKTYGNKKGYVYARRSKGMQANHFLADALSAAKG